MRIKQLITSILSTLIVGFACAQTIQYSEKAIENYTRFFYDSNYYLVDKDCEFKSIERVAVYDSVKLVFDGPFKDFDSNGKLIVQGNYTNGMKEGSFIGYHPNGEIKWKTTYVNNEPHGEWNYFYPDGKPMLSLSLTKDDFRIISLWDRSGNKKIEDGQGDYEMIIPIKGFTDHGYTSYIRKGKVVEGRPDGNWSISFISNDKKPKEIPVYFEKYSSGQLNTFNKTSTFYDYYIPYDEFLLVPSEYFNIAEYFIVNNCSFDEYSGFIAFIGKRLNHDLSNMTFEDNNMVVRYKIRYTVTKAGEPYNQKILEAPNNISNRDKTNLMVLLKTYPYFIPSVLDGKPIKDNITLTLDIRLQNHTGVIEYLTLERERGK